MNRAFVINDQHKSLGLAIVLTAVFGPVGLFYATIWGGLVMTIFGPLLFFILLFLGVAWNSELLMGLSLGTGIIFIIAAWITSIIWGFISVRKHNKKVDKAIQEKMYMLNSFQVKGNPLSHTSIKQDGLAYSNTRQVDIPSKSKPDIQAWLKQNPGKTINDYFIEFDR